MYVFSLAYTQMSQLSSPSRRDVTRTSVSNVQKVVNRPAFIYFHLGGGGGGGGGVEVVSVLHMMHLLGSYLCACMRTVVYGVHCSEYLPKHVAD